jgi:transcriptional regulator GlxA family with amidase domain
MSWRKDLRIREARHLLLDYPDLPVSVIGEMAGIVDKSNFKRQFCQATGMTPRRWREKHLH